MWTDDLRTRIETNAPPALCVAFSGGPDSTALLHALARWPEVRERRLRALHVDHGLHADSAGWAKHCADFCESLAVPLTTIRVQVHDTRGEGIEAVARRARYAAFAENLAEGEWLVLGHHRDDQVETVLLKLLRGAGPEGLGGMRALRPLARGQLWRPLLETPRASLREYLADNALPCIDDPANADPRFARNVLRREILPRIAAHWPHADASILHAARLCRTAAHYIDASAQTALAGLRRDADTLDVAGWLALPEALRAPVVDAWLRARGFSVPPDTARAELAKQAGNASEDSTPVIAWPGTEVRIWDGRLHATPPLASPAAAWQSQWDGAPLALPADCGELRLESIKPASTHTTHAPLDPPLTVCFRRGGERIKPAGDPHTRELRDLFQQARLPPWLRVRCPLIYENDALIAVADLWTSERGKAVFDACGTRPRWTRPACRRLG
ncbi:MAG TPA: tRNA lysidine(34) synthetase TilS [Rhodanobacteraceae bacterium]|nr:tRNA lysidine(34) synthetase TilS [Rhodanobacteraceae bacterium]